MCVLGSFGDQLSSFSTTYRFILLLPLLLFLLQLRLNAMNAFNGFKIEKLRKDNFHTWKRKIELLLTIKDLDDPFVTSAPTDKDGLRKWKKYDAKARGYIGLTLSDEHLNHVRDVTTAADL